MRILDRGEYPEHYALRLESRKHERGCRAWLRIYPPRFLLPGVRRPTGCAYWHGKIDEATRPWGWGGVRP
jgi:hypothetical protein